MACTPPHPILVLALFRARTSSSQHPLYKQQNIRKQQNNNKQQNKTLHKQQQTTIIYEATKQQELASAPGRLLDTPCINAEGMDEASKCTAAADVSSWASRMLWHLYYPLRPASRAPDYNWLYLNMRDASDHIKRR